MRHFEVRRVISAPPAAVWSVLIDARLLAGGRFGIEKIAGEITPGGTITIWSSVAKGRAFPLRVTAFEPQRLMTWTGGMPLGLFRGVRQFRLHRLDEGTEFTMREDYSGPLAGLFTKSIPDLNPSFELFADGLASTSEEIAR